MADSDKGNPQNPTAQGAGDAGAKPEYLLDKFATPEEQAKGYKELEKKYHEDLNAVKQEINALKKGVRLEDTQSYVPPQDADNQELVDLYKSPSQWKRGAIETAKQEFRVEQLAREAAKDMLSRFFSQNQDLQGQDFLLEGYLRSEDPRLDPADRLANAAKRTREHILNLKKVPESKPNPNEFVDEPSGQQGRVPSKSPASEADLRSEFFKDSVPRKMAPKRLPQGE